MNSLLGAIAFFALVGVVATGASIIYLNKLFSSMLAEAMENMLKLVA